MSAQPPRPVGPARRLLIGRRFADNWWSLGLGLAFFLVYAITAARDVLPADAGEYHFAIPQLKVLHPPGFPLYTLVGRLFIALFPLGSPAYRLNLLSAVLAAVTLVVLARTAHRLSGSALAGVIAAAALGASTTFWAQATTANVRTPTAVFTALCLYYLARLRSASASGGASNRSPSGDASNRSPSGDASNGSASGGASNRSASGDASYRSASGDASYRLFALSLGLGLTHHLSLAFMAVVFCGYILWLDPTLIRPSRRWLGPAIALLSPTLLWLYFPLREARFRTLAGLFEHVSARGFEGDFFYFAHWAQLPDRLVILGNILAFQFNPLLLVLIGLAFAFILLRDRRLFFLLSASFAVFAFVAITYRAPQTVEYLLPAYLVLALALGVGLATIRHLPREAAIRNSLLLLASFAALALFLRNLPSYLALAGDTSTRQYAEPLLAAVPPESLLLANWHWATPLWYLQQIEGQRRDVEIAYVFPQGESYAQNWVDRLNAEIASRPVIVTNYFRLEYSGLPYRFEPLASAFLVRPEARRELPEGFAPLDLGDTSPRLLGAQFVGEPPASARDALTLDLAWQADGDGPVSFFAQLIGPDGRLYAQADVNHAVHAASEVLIDRYRLILNPDALPGDYALIVGAYLPDGTRLAEHRLTTIPLGPARSAPPTAHPLFRWGLAPTLAGYDYDLSLDDSLRLYLHWRLGPRPETATLWASGSPFTALELPSGNGYITTAADLPLSAQDIAVVIGPGRAPKRVDWRTFFLRAPSPGDRYVLLGNSMALTGVGVTAEGSHRFRVDLGFLAARPLVEDFIVKVDLIGQNYSWRAQSDSVPAGGAIPTLKWIRGSRIADRHRLIVPPSAQPGPAALELAVYDHFTGQVLPILDSRLARLGPTVPLGSVTIPAQ